MTSPPAVQSAGYSTRAAARRRLKSMQDEHSSSGAKGGRLRAAIFGANDGLVSNAALVIGVAAAAFRILVATEEDLTRIACIAPGEQQHNGLGLGKDGQVIEVAIRAKRKMRIGIAYHFRRCRQRRDAASALSPHLVDETRPALAILLMTVVHLAG